LQPLLHTFHNILTYYYPLEHNELLIYIHDFNKIMLEVSN